MTFNAGELQSLRTAFLTCGTLSILGSLFIIISFFLIRELRRRILMQFIFFMSICDLLFTLKFWLAAAMDKLKLDSLRNNSGQLDSFCLFESVLHQFFGLASISWYGCISLLAFRAIFTNDKTTYRNSIQQIINNNVNNSSVNNDDNNRHHSYSNSIVSAIFSNPLNSELKLNVLCHIFVWSLSLITTIISYSYDTFGNSSDSTCWIDSEHQKYRLLFIIPLLIYFALATALLVTVIIKRSQLEFSGENNIFTRMLVFVLFFVATWLPSLLMRLYELNYKPNNLPFPLVLTHGITVTLQGFINLMIWITYPTFDNIFVYFKRKFNFLAKLCCFWHPVIYRKNYSNINYINNDDYYNPSSRSNNSNDRNNKDNYNYNNNSDDIRSRSSSNVSVIFSQNRINDTDIGLLNEHNLNDHVANIHTNHGINNGHNNNNASISINSNDSNDSRFATESYNEILDKPMNLNPTTNSNSNNNNAVNNKKTNNLHNHKRSQTPDRLFLSAGLLESVQSRG